ncbi:MAG: DUF1028 domain-containing protein [Flavobacteriales bacterium]|nr:DUF1028 domain-containing protein [Flavobacteriales bacterium]
MKKLFFTLLLIVPFFGKSQHTFSIVAIDSITGEIGSAGATCGDSIIWPGTSGALIISDIIPGVGAIHTQSYHHATNQLNANNRMALGDSPQDIIDWLVANDVASDPAIRQYGIVDFNGGSPRSSAYTGANCFDYKNHILGPNYAIQGNILLGQQILDSMEFRFNSTNGCLSDKLMAAMQGAKIVGADTRCTSEGTSSLSAFLQVAKPSDHPDTLFIDLNIAGTPTGVEPINELQTKYDAWKSSNNHNCSTVVNSIELVNENEEFLIYPNPTDGSIQIKVLDKEITNIIITDITGKIILSQKVSKTRESILLSLNYLSSGLYVITLFNDHEIVESKKITLHNVR